MRLLPGAASAEAQVAEVAVGADVRVLGLGEGDGGVVQLLQQGIEACAELVCIGGKVRYGDMLARRAHLDDGRVAFGRGPVDVEQGGATRSGLVRHWMAE